MSKIEDLNRNLFSLNETSQFLMLVYGQLWKKFLDSFSLFLSGDVREWKVSCGWRAPPTGTAVDRHTAQQVSSIPSVPVSHLQHSTLHPSLPICHPSICLPIWWSRVSLQTILHPSVCCSFFSSVMKVPGVLVLQFCSSSPLCYLYDVPNWQDKKSKKNNRKK